MARCATRYRAASKGDTIVFGSDVRGTITLEEPLDIDATSI